MAPSTGMMLWLKDKSIGIPERLKLTKFAWASESIHVPNKYQQLLDFICGLLVNKKKHGLQGQDILLTWKTLHLFLQVSNQSINVKPSILQAITEDLGDHHGMKSSKNHDQNFLNVIVPCACSLLQLPSMTSASFEHLCSVLNAACNLMSCKDSEDAKDIDTLIQAVLPPLVRCQRAHLNQSQVFHIVVDKTLSSALQVIAKCSSQSREHLQDFLIACLLHSDHNEGYAQYLQHGEEVSNSTKGSKQNHPPVKQPPKSIITFFSTLQTLIACPDKRPAVFNFLPFFLENFIKQNLSEQQLCFLMLRKLVSMFVSVEENVPKEEQNLNKQPSLGIGQDTSVSDSWWLEPVAECLGACQKQSDLDLFSAVSKQNSTAVLNWFSSLTQLVLQQNCNSMWWYNFMQHVVNLNHLVVEKFWDRVLQRCMADDCKDEEDTRIACNKFLCELIHVYQRLRRASDLISALMKACLACPIHVTRIQDLPQFHARLSTMINEAPLTSLLDILEKVQKEAELLTSNVVSSPSGTDLSHLDWLLALLTCLLAHARLFDHRSSGAFFVRITSLTGSIGNGVLGPCFRVKQIRKSCSSLEGLLQTWSYAQVMRLPRWQGNHQDKNEDIIELDQLRKLSKRLPVPDQARLGLQHISVATPHSCPFVMEGDAETTTLNNVVDMLLEMPSLSPDLVTSVWDKKEKQSSVSTTSIANFFQLCKLVTLAGLQLSEEMLHRCADITLSILGQGHGQAWLHTGGSFMSEEGQTTLLSLARCLILHPAVRELRPFQLRLATEAWTELCTSLSSEISSSPPKKRKKRESGAAEKDLKPDLVAIVSFLSGSTNEEGVSVSLLKIKASMEVSSKSVEMINVLSKLDLEYLPSVSLRCQIGSALLLSCLLARNDCEAFKCEVERLFLQSLSLSKSSSLFKMVDPEELLTFAINYRVENPSSRKELLQVVVQTVMNDHKAVICMPAIVKKLLSNSTEDDMNLTCVKYQVLALLVRFCYKYLKKAFHIQQVADAARETYFCVAKFVIKNGLTWFEKVKEDHENCSSNSSAMSNQVETSPRKEGRGKKRKQEKSQTPKGLKVVAKENQEESTVVGQASHALLLSLTQVLNLWEQDAADEKLNHHLQTVVSQVLSKVTDKLKLVLNNAEKSFSHSGIVGIEPEMLMVQAVCYCQHRSQDQTGDETDDNDSSTGLQLITTQTRCLLFTLCIEMATEAVKHRLMVEANRLSGSMSISEPKDEQVQIITDTLTTLIETANEEEFKTFLERLLCCLASSDKAEPAAVTVAVETWRKVVTSANLAHSLSRIVFKYMYKFLSSVLSIMQNTQNIQSHTSTNGVTLIGQRETSRIILKALTQFVDMGKAQVTSRMTLLCMHAGFSINFISAHDVEAVCELVNALLVRHANTALTALPAVLDLMNKLLRACMSLAGQERLTSKPEELPDLLHCAQVISRLLNLMSTPTYKPELQKIVHTVLAEYLIGLQKETLHTAVKVELLRGLYKIMDITDKFRLASLNAALPAGVKDTFKVLHQEYNKYHRYTGVV